MSSLLIEGDIPKQSVDPLAYKKITLPYLGEKTIPKNITDDESDKLKRKIWEFEQRLIGIERTTLDSVELDKLFDKMNDMEQQINRLNIEHELLMSMVTLLGRAEEFRIKKHVDKLPKS